VEVAYGVEVAVPAGVGEVVAVGSPAVGARVDAETEGTDGTDGTEAPLGVGLAAIGLHADPRSVRRSRMEILVFIP
jgi:hypothetical protein